MVKFGPMVFYLFGRRTLSIVATNGRECIIVFSFWYVWKNVSTSWCQLPVVIKFSRCSTGLETGCKPVLFDSVLPDPGINPNFGDF